MNFPHFSWQLAKIHYCPAHSQINPAILMTQHSKIISNHLNIIHKAQEAFKTNKNCEKIRRALRHNMCTSNENIWWLCILQMSIQQKMDRTSQRSRKRWATGRGKAQVYICSLPSLPSLIRTVKSTSAILTSSNIIKQCPLYGTKNSIFKDRLNKSNQEAVTDLMGL